MYRNIVCAKQLPKVINKKARNCTPFSCTLLNLSYMKIHLKNLVVKNNNNGWNRLKKN